MNYHIGRLVLSSLHVGAFVAAGIWWCKTNTTKYQPQQKLQHKRTENKTTDVVIHQHSRKLLKMDILMSETCWAPKWNKIASDIKLVFHSSTIAMTHGPINIRWDFVIVCLCLGPHLCYLNPKAIMDTILNQFSSHNLFFWYTYQILLCLPCTLSPTLKVRVCSLLCNTEIPFTYSVRKSWRDLYPTTSCSLRWKKVFLSHKRQYPTGHCVTCSLPGSFACQRIIEATVCVLNLSLCGKL